MKRFAGVLAVVAVAAAVLVAMASGGQQAGPTAKQFAALKKTVTKLQKQVKAAKQEADGALGFVLTCVAHQPLAVDSVGTTTTGFLFGTPPVGPNVASQALPALSLAPATETTPQYKVFVLNTANTGCASIVSGASTLTALRHLPSFGH